MDNNNPESILIEIGKAKEIISSGGYVPEWSARLGEMEKQARESLAVMKTGEYDGFKILLNKLKMEVQIINKELCTNRNLTEVQRQMFFERKDWIARFTGYFDLTPQIQAMKEYLSSLDI